MKSRTATCLTLFGRASCWAIGLGLITIGLGEAAYGLMVCLASERQG
jgi:hypothetical protein